MVRLQVNINGGSSRHSVETYYLVSDLVRPGGCVPRLFCDLIDSTSFQMEAAVSASQGVMGSLPTMLGSVESERRIPKEVRSMISLLKADIQELNALLLEPSEVVHPKSTAESWMKEVRELSYDVDDFLDELAIKTTLSAASSGLQRKITTRLHLQEQFRRRRIIADVSRLRVRVKEAIERHKNYGLGNRSLRSPCTPDDHRELALNGEGATGTLLGIDRYVEKIGEWLTDGEKLTRVVSIVGSMGVGKTTLARKLYNDVGGQFECCAFVQTSKMPDSRTLLKSLMSQLQRQEPLHETWDEKSLIKEIKTHLQGKRYIIVIDNLCTAPTWDIVTRALLEGPEDHCCSRVLITTEIDVVAQECSGFNSKHTMSQSIQEKHTVPDGKYKDIVKTVSLNENYIFKLEPLNDNASKDLLASRVFGDQHKCPVHLNGFFSEVARKCGGLPQAVIGAANLLASWPVNEWNHVNESLIPDLRTGNTSEGMAQLLSNTFENLPPNLKACMLYLSIYKEDYIIKQDDLVKQWMAEGFVCAIGREDMEDVARSHFLELVHKGMIEPVDIGYNDDIVSCTLHRMVFNVIRHKAMEENFVTVVDHSQTGIRLADNVRRLSLHFGNSEDAKPPENIRLTHVRSLVCFGLLNTMPSIIDFHLLRVLIIHLQGEDDKVFNLTNISELFRLRSLQIECNGRVKLPSELSGLKYLETLQIDSRVASVPSDIFHLPQLLHLRLPPSLQHFGDSRNEQSNNTDKKRLANHQLQDLQLICFPVTSDYLERNMKVLGLILQLFKSLKSLTVVPSHFPTYNSVHGASRNAISCDDIGFVVSSSPSLLQRLELYPHVCVFSTLPSWIRNLEKLSVLKISVIQLGVEDIKTLSLLGALTALSLYVRTTLADSIIFDESGFRVLKYFKFKCSTISSLSFKNGAMPNLQKLKMGFNDSTVEQCNLANVGFEHLSTIKEIIIKIRVIDESGRIAIDRSTLRDAIRSNISTSTNVIVRLTDREFYGKKDKCTPGGVSEIQQDSCGDSSRIRMVLEQPPHPQGREIMLSNKNFKDLPAEIAHQFHPAHKLRLAVGTETNWPSRCGGCKEPGAGRRYTCEPCNLTLYMCCATAPHALEHPLFPGLAFRLREKPPPVAECGRACDACGDLLDEDGFVYHSSDPAAGAERGLDLHPRCARLPARAVSTRRYAFELRKKVASRGRCGICMCGEDGYRHRFWSYRFYYDDEAVHLHIACLKDLASQSHQTLTKLYDILMDGMQWMPTNNWVVTTERSVDGSSEKDGSRVLPEEQDEITEFQYRRKGAHGSMELTAVTDTRPRMDCELPRQSTIQGNLAMTIMEEFVQTPETITHRSHPQHKLRLVTTTCDAPFECDGCEEPGEGPRYCCRTDGCKFDLHKFCAQAPRKLHHDLFQGRTFVFLDRPPPGPSPPRPDGPRRCDTCGDPVRGWCYHCPGANIDLHPCCASLQGAAITLDGLAFDIGAPSRCSLCRTDKGGGRRHREQWCYHTDIDGEGVYLHVACVKHLARRRWLAGREKKYGGQIMLASEELMKEGPLKSISSEQARKIVGAAVRIIITVIFGDPTAIVGDVDTWVPLPLRWLADLFSIQS